MKELAEALKGTTGIRMRQGVVTAVAGDACSVAIGGSDLAVDGVQHLNSCSPKAGDVVWIASDGADLWIIGTHGPAPAIDPALLPAFDAYFTGADPEGAPEAVTGLTGAANLGGLILAWDLPAEALWRAWEVYEGDEPGFSPLSVLLTTNQTVVGLTRDPGSGPYYYQVRALNTRGEASAAVEVGPFTIPLVTAPDIGEGSVHAAALAAGAVDLAAATVTGQLLAERLADNAVTLAKVDATVTDLIDDAAAAAASAGGQAAQALADAAAAQAAAAEADAAAADAASGAAAAQAAAGAADAAAAEAAGIAASKAVVLYQTAAPSAAYQNATTLWIDTTGGANTPKRWTGAAWIAVTDKAATDAAAAAATATATAGAAQTTANNAAAAAATADGKAVAAQGTADTALANAATASGTANTALTAANGKNKIVFSTSDASGTAYTAGDVWFKKSGTIIVAQWEFVAGAWSARTLDSAVIANLDAGKITAGTIHVDRLAAGSILAAKLNVADVQAAVVTAAKVNALALDAGAITAGTLAAARIAAGSITAAKLDVADVQASVVTAAKVNALALSADAITAGTLSAARIGANSIDAGKVNVASLQAAIVTATVVNALALNAGSITAGILSADRIAAGAITAAKLNVADVQAAVVTAAKINTLTLNAVSITGGSITGVSITGQTITGGTIRTAASGPPGRDLAAGVHGHPHAERLQRHGVHAGRDGLLPQRERARHAAPEHLRRRHRLGAGEHPASPAPA